MENWIDGKGPDDDVVLSSRIRLARNLSMYPFPIAMSEEDSEKVKKEIISSIKINSVLNNEFDVYDMKDTSQLDRIALVEKHLISPDLAKLETGAAMIKKDEKVSILINEEDHLRIQTIFPGLQLDGALDLANKIDDLIEENVKYAYDPELGYLTSCPTNLGTGIRASVMIHLPALVITDQIKPLLVNLNKLGIAVRGIYGEGTEALGNIFQISNQITLGQTEEEIIQNLKGVTSSIVKNERIASQEVYKNNKLRIEDMVYRSYGTLVNARVLSMEECMKYLSDIRLGKSLGIIDGDIPVNELLVYIQPANIQKMTGKEMTPFDRDVTRAEYVRNKILRR